MRRKVFEGRLRLYKTMNATTSSVTSRTAKQSRVPISHFAAARAPNGVLHRRCPAARRAPAQLRARTPPGGLSMGSSDALNIWAVTR
eukprot:1913237-Pleurochrysis_carterae.AAC.3